MAKDKYNILEEISSLKKRLDSLRSGSVKAWEAEGYSRRKWGGNNKKNAFEIINKKKKEGINDIKYKKYINKINQLEPDRTINDILAIKGGRSRSISTANRQTTIGKRLGSRRLESMDLVKKALKPENIKKAKASKNLLGKAMSARLSDIIDDVVSLGECIISLYC